MRWPRRHDDIVKLAELEAALAVHRVLSDVRLAQIVQLNEDVAYLRALIATKDEQLVHMVRDGYTPHVPVPVGPVEETDLPPAVMIEIDKLAEPRSGHWMELVRDAQNLMQRLDADPALVAASIKAGGDFDPYA